MSRFTSLFTKRTPVPAKWYETPREPTAWERLERLGYYHESCAADNGLRHYSILKKGQLMSDWTTPLSADEWHDFRRSWAEGELLRLQK